jgi:hypothetical protein
VITAILGVLAVSSFQEAHVTLFSHSSQEPVLEEELRGFLTYCKARSGFTKSLTIPFKAELRVFGANPRLIRVYDATWYREGIKEAIITKWLVPDANGVLRLEKETHATWDGETRRDYSLGNLPKITNFKGGSFLAIIQLIWA